MRLKILLFLMMIIGVLHAQQPNRSLVITEARMDGQHDNHVELTNMGATPINLSEYKFGLIRPWLLSPIYNVFNDPWVPDGNRFYMLPDVILEPGESFVQSVAHDFGPRMYRKGVAGFEGAERQKQADIYDLADLLIHIAEPKGDATDSVTRDPVRGDVYQWTWETWVGRGSFFVEHHFAPGDSAVVDQVGGVFDNDGRNFARPYDVAGVTGATGNSLLVRKYSVKTGNLDFANARGVGLEDSEWMPITRPTGYNAWRDLWWTVGNHGPYVLDENTLESDVIEVDFANKKLTVPWGVRRLDDIMRHMKKKPGVAWNYHLNSNRQDSLYYSARTGDKITIYVVGNTLQKADFNIEVSEPTADANIVVPKARVNIGSAWRGGPIRTNTQAGIDGIDWPRITRHDHGTDTITGTWHGLPNALRTDTLMKYLEKPANATWEFEFADDVARPDLKNGDKLKVTSANGSVKTYHLQVRPYGPSHNANLSSITWPDIPDFYRGIFGWVGDTVPGFNPTTYSYRVQVPYDADGIPALIYKTQNLNAKVDVQRATSLAGTVEDRSVSFIVTAEDDSVQNTYTVELVKGLDPSLPIQPYEGDPFMSEYTWWDQWTNAFLEIVNPGNQPLDLSNYMIASEDWIGSPAGMIENFSGLDDYDSRYAKYVPGYKYVSESEWAVNPGILVQDLSVNSIVQPGDVFVLGAIDTDFQLPANYEWPVIKQMDVQFYNRTGIRNTYTNTMGEEIGNEWAGNPIRKWMNGNIYLFKILNDSIKNGLKPANDPNDFELIDVFGMGDGTDWIIGGKQAEMITTYRRKPHIHQGNPEYKGSFGTNWDDSEWYKEDWPFWQARNVGYPLEILNIVNDLGQHYMDEPTHYKSTVNSRYYKVSDGFSMEELIEGVVTGTTVADFISKIVKSHEDQVLTVMSGGTELANEDVLSHDDVLVVVSADGENTSQYLIEVTDGGLSSNAVLTSTQYDIEIVSEPKSATQEDENAGSATISGFEYGTQLRTVIQNVNVPPGASMDVIDGSGAYVSTRKLNFDTAYVNVTVNSDIYFDVVAEDGVTRIVYQLLPTATADDAFIVSDIYTVAQADNLVHFVPRGTAVSTFLSNITPAFNATVKIVDKMGHERTEGTVRDDDKVVVTSQNGNVTRVYHLSMLRTQYIFETTYLAYVLSDTYRVDQVDYKIAGPTTTTGVSDFYSLIRPSMGATAVVVDADGNERASGDLAHGDMVKVTSADGKIEVMYALELTVVSVKLPQSAQIEIYPNPTTGKLNVRGVDTGSRIQVYNATGAIIRDMKVQSSLEVLSIDDQPAGMYLIVISNNNQLLGRYKAIKK